MGVAGKDTIQERSGKEGLNPGAIMTLADSLSSNEPTPNCSGGVTEFGAVAEVVDQIEAFLRHVLPEIAPKIPGFRSDTGKRRNERKLASDLSKWLNFEAHSKAFHFEPEDPENESATRTLDYGVYPSVYLKVGPRLLGATHRLYGIEAKRLRTRTSSIEKVEREREYVVGEWNLRTSPNKNLKGGIERFKEGLHGADLDRAGMIGFIQEEDASYWLSEVNHWIGELILHPLPSHRAPWENQDKLQSSMSEGRVAEFRSKHARAELSVLSMAHFWIHLA